MATHSSILVWERLWTKEPGGLQSMGLQKSRIRLKRLNKQHVHTWMKTLRLRAHHLPSISQGVNQPGLEYKCTLLSLSVRGV